MGGVPIKLREAHENEVKSKYVKRVGKIAGVLEESVQNHRLLIGRNQKFSIFF